MKRNGNGSNGNLAPWQSHVRAQLDTGLNGLDEYVKFEELLADRNGEPVSLEGKFYDIVFDKIQLKEGIQPYSPPEVYIDENPARTPVVIAKNGKLTADDMKTYLTSATTQYDRTIANGKNGKERNMDRVYDIALAMIEDDYGIIAINIGLNGEKVTLSGREGFLDDDHVFGLTSKTASVSFCYKDPMCSEFKAGISDALARRYYSAGAEVKGLMDPNVVAHAARTKRELAPAH